VDAPCAETRLQTRERIAISGKSELRSTRCSIARSLAGRIDVAADYGFRLPAWALSDLLGVRTKDRARVVQWSVLRNNDRYSGSTSDDAVFVVNSL
jgi:hypothetical protein